MLDFAKMQEQTQLSNDVIKMFTESAHSQYGSHSYACGYLGSVLVQAMNSMPKKQRELILKDLAKAAEHFGKKEVDTASV
jgi:hypothetical protein